MINQCLLRYNMWPDIFCVNVSLSQPKSHMFLVLFRIILAIKKKSLIKIV